MPIFETSDINSTGLTVNGKTTLSGNSTNNILVISGSNGPLVTVQDNSASSTLFSVSNTGGTVFFSVVTNGTRVHTALFDSTGSQGTTGQLLRSTVTGVTWSTQSRQIGLIANLGSPGATGTINQSHVGIGYSGTITG